MDATFKAALHQLAQLAGADVLKVLEDEHLRWNVYEASVSDPARRQVLMDAIRGEVNGPLASAVVSKVLETVQDGDRSTWVELLPEGRLRAFGEVRAAELRLFEELTEGKQIKASPAVVGHWSQWLQKRLAERVENTQVLEGLAEAGATKGIRRLARERLNARGS